jgi:hypothetical protein
MEEADPHPNPPPESEWRSAREPINSFHWEITPGCSGFPARKAVGCAGLLVLSIMVVAWLVRGVASSGLIHGAGERP